MSKKSSDDNSESVIRGNREKILRGWDVRRHTGYMFIEDEKTWEKILVPDPKRYDLIKRAIHLVLQQKPVLEVLDMLNNDWGYRSPKTRKMGNKPISKSNFYNILHDEFYCGCIYTDNEQKIKGNHQPMISETEFDQLQIILADRGKSRPKSVDLPYRTLIKCGECGCTVCLEEKHQTICSKCKTKFASKNRHHCINCNTPISEMENPTRLYYIYGRCTKKKRGIKCSQKAIKFEDLEQQLTDFLSGIEISPKVEQWVLKQLKKQTEQETQTHDQARNNLQRNLNSAQRRLDSLLKAFTAPENSDYKLILPDEYSTQKKQLLEEKKQTEEKLTDSLRQSDSYMDLAEQTFNFAVTACERFTTGDYKAKTEIIRNLGSNLILKDRKITVEQEYPWLYLQKAHAELAELKEVGLEPKKSIVIYEEKGLVDPVISTLQAH